MGIKTDTLVGALLFSTLICFSAASATAHAQAVNPDCAMPLARNLSIGSSGADVLQLQKLLNKDVDTQIQGTGPGSPGNEGTYYGSLTASAVSRFQMKYKQTVLTPSGLISGTGKVGTLTRAKLNQLCAPAVAASSTTSTSTDSDMLTIAPTDQPVQTLAPAGAGGVPFTNFTLTAGSADVTVNDIIVERSGPGADGAFDSIALNDENGEQIGDERSFTSDHKVQLGDPFVIPAHTSKKLSIVGNMSDDLTDFAGQTPILQIDAVESSTTIVGTLPLRGTPQVVNDTLVIGGAIATLSQDDPGTNSNRYIGDTGIRFSGIGIQANSQEDLTLSSIAWRQDGTANNTDLANVVVVVNGVSYPTEIDDKSFTATFSPGIVIPKGQTVDAYIKGDLTTTGSQRTVQFDIDSSDDIALTGNTYGYGVGVSAGGNTATAGNSVFITSDGTTDGDEGTPFFAGSIATINAGTATYIGK